MDLQASETAMTEHICKKLAAPTPEASAAVVEIVEENMAAAARVHAAESGKEIRNRVLIGFGGGAPLHVANVMAKLGMTQFLVPMGAGPVSNTRLTLPTICRVTAQVARVSLTIRSAQH